MEEKQTSVSKPKKNMKYMRDKEREKVKGVFRNFEVPGGELAFVYKKYPQDQPERFKLRDGQIYEIPLGVAKHLNTSGWYPQHAHAVNADGKSIAKIGKKVRRYAFQSMEFVDPDDFETADKAIITVENV